MPRYLYYRVYNERLQEYYAWRYDYVYERARGSSTNQQGWSQSTFPLGCVIQFYLQSGGNVPMPYVYAMEVPCATTNS